MPENEFKNTSSDFLLLLLGTRYNYYHINLSLYPSKSANIEDGVAPLALLKSINHIIWPYSTQSVVEKLLKVSKDFSSIGTNLALI